MAQSSETRALDVQQKGAKQALAEDKWDDCMACRVTGMFRIHSKALTSMVLICRIGSAAFIGLGIYSYHTGMTTLRKQEKMIMQNPTKYKMGSRQLGIAAISASLIGMGLWRAFN